MDRLTKRILAGLRAVATDSALGLRNGALLFATILLYSGVVSAAPAMTDINFSAMPGGKFEVRMAFDGTPPEPTGFTIEKPARIALDLPGVSSSLEKKKHTLSFDNAQSVRVLEAGGRTRVIIDLVTLAPYETKVVGNELVVLVGGETVPDYAKAATGMATHLRTRASAVGPSSSISDFNFERGTDGEGRVVLTLSNPNVEMDVNLEGNTIRLTFFDTGVPEDLRRRYDVSDFATPVRLVDINEAGSQATIDIRASGAYDYLAYQTDQTYVVSVKPLTPEQVEAKAREFAFTGDKLSLNFQDIEIRAVLQLIADFTDLNLVASDTVSGRITLRLQNVPWDQALDLILKTKGLDKRQVGNVLMVAPAAEIAERERQELETNKQIEELAPLQTEFIRVKYADARELFELFKNRGEGREGGRGDGPSTGSILSERGQVIVDERTNSLLVTETPERLEQFRRLMTLIDVPVRQVMIEARIVIAGTDFSKQLGIQWGGAYDSDYDNKEIDIAGGIAPLDSVANGGVGAVNVEDALFVDVPVTAQGASRFAIGIASNDLVLRAEISALEASGNGEVVSQPKVITGDKQSASIMQGTEIPYQEASSSGATSTSFKDAVLKLDVTPHITPDDRIMMTLTINQDSVGEVTATGIPTIDTTELNTQVLVGNGETIVLGGVFQNEETYSVTQTPFLGDLPFIGRLFKRTQVDQSKAETLIFITPRILSDKLLD